MPQTYATEFTNPLPGIEHASPRAHCPGLASGALACAVGGCREGGWDHVRGWERGDVRDRREPGGGIEEARGSGIE